MFDLIKKDLVVGWIVLLGITLLIPFITSIAIMAMIDDFGGLILGVFGLITFGLCLAGAFLFISVDTVYEADRHLVSLPLKRSKIVIARYLSMWLCLTFNYSLVILSCLVAVYYFNQSDPLLDRLLTWRGIFAPYLMLIFILLYMLPFIFKFSTNKGTLIAVTTQAVLLLINPAHQLLNKWFPELFAFDFTWILQKLQAVLQWLSQQSTVSIYAGIVILIAGVAVISLALSIRFYNRRDI